MTDMLTMRVGAARASDARAVAGLIEAMGGHEGAADRSGTVEQFAEVLALPHVAALVAAVGGRVVGYAELHARPSVLNGVREGWLAALAVRPECRGHGIGTVLIGAIEDEARRLGCESIVLESSEFRTKAHQFYLTLGFEQVRPARRFYRPVADGRPSSASQSAHDE
jgi:GNAT superfamily N-acetyltransferase